MAGENHESGGVSVTAPADTDDLEDRIEAQREEFTDLLEDVRSRVVQVKRETDDKAPADHGHESYAPREDVADFQDDLDELERRLETGFDNYEEIVEQLLDRIEVLEDRSMILAKTVAAIRDRPDGERGRNAVDRLQRRANRQGIRAATCENCDSSVDLALLNVPECPHCESPIADVVGDSSLFGSDRLVIGDPDESAPPEPTDGEDPSRPEPTDQEDSTTDERR
ncbi:hypothetical protein [Natrialba sp. INN-245]|uniref:hypothetical protein n=1 Tax=Natrialba sp. INN-245 TaxID=2690967 RepID=UPI001311C39E|nr:hypothetical protein [Natrialba sp. INN-245]MWV39457.1 hypothetical protein [Natrialba sp. INN-245]